MPRLGLLKKGSWKAEAEEVKKQARTVRERRRAEKTLWCPAAGVQLRHHVVRLDAFKAPRRRALAAAGGELTGPILAIGEKTDGREIAAS